MKNETDRPLTSCPFCDLDGKIGDLKKGEGRTWFCLLCGHDFKNLNEILRAMNVAKSQKRLSESQKKRSKNIKNSNLKKAPEVGQDRKTNTMLEFTEIACFHCGKKWTVRNKTIYLHRFSRAVGWLEIDHRHFCPICYSREAYKKYG